MTDREALQIAFNALAAIDRETPYPIAKHAIKCINETLRQPAEQAEKQEPAIDKRIKVKLGTQYGRDLNGHWFYLQPADEDADQALTKHSGVSAPPQREWVGLTDDDYPAARAGDHAYLAGWREAEAKLKEKNT